MANIRHHLRPGVIQTSLLVVAAPSGLNGASLAHFIVAVASGKPTKRTEQEEKVSRQIAAWPNGALGAPGAPAASSRRVLREGPSRANRRLSVRLVCVCAACNNVRRRSPSKGRDAATLHCRCQPTNGSAPFLSTTEVGGKAGERGVGGRLSGWPRPGSLWG